MSPNGWVVSYLSVFVYSAVALFYLVLPLYLGLSARVDATKVPWIRLFRNPIYLGASEEDGKFIINSYLRWMAVWLAISYLFLALCFLSITGLHYFLLDFKWYQSYFHDGSIAATINSAVRSISILGFYSFLAKKAKGPIHWSSENIQENLNKMVELALENSSNTERLKDFLKFYDKNSVSAENNSSIRGYSTTRAFFRNIFYAPSAPFSTPLAQLERNCSNILRACVNIILQQYEPSTICNFWDQHKVLYEDKESTKKICAHLESFKELNLNSYQHAEAILYAKIRVTGFRRVENYIRQYNKSLIRDEKRHIGRVPKKCFCEIDINGSGHFRHGTIHDACTDGSGFYIAPEDPQLRPNGLQKDFKVFVKCDDFKLEGLVKNIKNREIGNKAILGFGVEIDEANRSNVAEYISRPFNLAPS